MVHMDHTPLSRLGEILAADLDKAGLTMRQAAWEAGIPRTTLDRHMRTGYFTVPELAALAALLKTRPSTLVRRAERAA